MISKSLVSTLALVLSSSLVASQDTGSHSTSFPSSSVYPSPSITVTASASLPSSTSHGGNDSFVRVTALVGENNRTALQCWQLQPEPYVSQDPGTIGARIQALGNINNANLAFFNGTSSSFVGLHPAPQPQWIAILAGGGDIRVPGSGEFVALRQGDLFIANDSAVSGSQGHDAIWFPGTVALQLPIVSGTLNYTLVNNNGSCAAFNHTY